MPTPPRAAPARLALAVAMTAAIATGCITGCGSSSHADPAPAADSSGTTRSSGGGGAVACRGDNGGLRLPPGFCATLVADSIGATRDLVVAPNGDVFVNAMGSRMQEERSSLSGSVVALRDTSHRGIADVVERFGSHGGTGIGLRGGYLYQDVGSAIIRWPLRTGSLRPSGEPDTVVADLPTAGHPARNFVIDGDALYVNVGSRTNSCQENDRRPESPGIDPCSELATRAGIWKFSATRTGQRFSPDARWAMGIRNAVALAQGPDGKLYAVAHGRDQLGQNWPKLFTPEQSAELPGEEFLQVQHEGDYGWPYCYYDGQKRHLVLAPEYGGDGTRVGRCRDKIEPMMAFPGHWAPDGLLFYTGTMFPAQYRGGAFIAFHGSWNRAPLPQEGFRVTFAPFTNGRPTGTFETFAEAAGGGTSDGSQPRQVRFRFVGLAQAPDGALYLSDDSHGRIWRVTYAGP